MRDGVEDKDSPMILEECLKDTDWMQSVNKLYIYVSIIFIINIFMYIFIFCLAF